MVELWRCQICGDPYIGERPPANCPFCGAHRKFIKQAKEAKVTFDIELKQADKQNVEEALKKEVSNATFYLCAAKQTDDDEGKLLFKALAKVELEHANIWRKILKLDSSPQANDSCHTKNVENLQESHDRETKTIDFYRNALSVSKNKRIKQILKALIEIESDHLLLSEARLNPAKGG
jgi:rubrerythrin